MKPCAECFRYRASGDTRTELGPVPFYCSIRVRGTLVRLIGIGACVVSSAFGISRFLVRDSCVFVVIRFDHSIRCYVSACSANGVFLP